VALLGWVCIISLAQLGLKEQPRDCKIVGIHFVRADVALLGWVSVAGVLPKYFSSEWSFAQFRIPEDSRAMVAFGPQKHTVLIACANGR
jgi:hypothetical protein